MKVNLYFYFQRYTNKINKTNKKEMNLWMKSLIQSNTIEIYQQEQYYFDQNSIDDYINKK
ncbi:hypothetical protein TTHERM_000408751 (macronuclear) [Tetrahymena thermophila SB210]|uniref:Uncharacterized protein n=1 Tax=Tetrahymena thermophila (strain SB210) TaxID=312017 RepID=W7X745_TETTS|nr:hypothetical protein TTHERM_000408751 [Tetrahymena thermophila SB210]EWS73182.1 hypothetical protein TTHERM_000408751 [Tetrahymena thermophila SB210]|eukprot:XP_012654258.1 hypothetical protein TTHERM_000408751 [Tetrahymena thermophila SB210]